MFTCVGRMRWLFLVVTFLALPTISSAQFSNLDEAGKQQPHFGESTGRSLISIVLGEELSALFQLSKNQLSYFLERFKHAHALNRHTFQHRLALFLQLLAQCIHAHCIRQIALV
jgi:hypothetical protein